MCTLIDCALSPPEALTHWLMKSRLQGEISLTFSSNCHGRSPTNLISFFFLPREHLMRAQIVLPKQSHADCPHPCVPSSLLLSHFICVSLSCLCSAASEQRPKPPSCRSKVTVKGGRQDTMRRRYACFWMKIELASAHIRLSSASWSPPLSLHL